jgi:glycosyltransferase involved in cell wall biosynthesis
VAFYNQEVFVQETVMGALAQTYPNLEIILSDDCSTDNTFQAIKEAVKDYNGPHKIVINRNEPNMGLVPHVNRELFELSHGDFIFLNGGDDISLPNRIERGVDYFLHYEDVSAVTFSRITIDKCGNEIGRENVDGDIIQSINDSDYLLSSGFMTKGVGLSFRRSLLDLFGLLNNDSQTEDSTLRFRAMLAGKTLKSSEYGLKYRVHDSNMTQNIFKLKTQLIANQYMRDIKVARGWLDDNICNILEKKVSYYVKTRTYDELASKTNKLGRFYYELLKNLVVISYKKEFEKFVRVKNV